MILGFKLVENHLEELERRIKMLAEAQVSYGMFSTEIHDTRTGVQGSFTDVALFRYLHNGNVKMNLKDRPVLTLTAMWNPISKSPMKKELKRYFSNIKTKKTQKDVDMILHSVGTFYRDKAASLMGDPNKIAPNTESTQAWKSARGYDPSKPFVETGRLQRLISYNFNGTSYEYGK